VNLRDNFLKALEENEGDINLRLVYADWLDDQGEHEEADRQRKWAAARDWLVKLGQKVSDWYGDPYPALLDFGRRVSNAGEVHQLHEQLGIVIEANEQDFWKNWSIVTGEEIPNLENKRFQSRYIPGSGTCEECGDNVYYFGFPLPPEERAPPVREERDEDTTDRYDDDFHNERGW
jgi:uncharacterized protein (TIGR02996 family)